MATNYSLVKKKIETKKASVCIMGLGYVGLPLAVAFAHRGYKVYGFDPSSKRVKKLVMYYDFRI